MSFQPVQAKGVAAARGFRSAGVAAGIKESKAPDLALILSDRHASVAGTFTTNRAAAAPVLLTRDRVKKGSARGVVINSGNANSCTGKRGLGDAVAMAAHAAKATGVAPEDMLVCSTGVIGVYLPMPAVLAGIEAAAKALGDDYEDASRAIMTTDTRPKHSAVAHSGGWALGGIAKGAAMIAPNMATMLAFITTDAAVHSRNLQAALSEAVASTFNSITVDGDTSTNDTVLAFANGASGVTPETDQLTSALQMVCRSLSEQMIADGEGATKSVSVRIRGAAGEEDARRAARAVAESLLVKTAMYGNDPNWGRIAAAIGYSQAAFDMERLSISIGGHDLLVEGVPADEKVSRLAAVALRQSSEVVVVCDLRSGDYKAEMLTTDLSPEYVKLNSEYTT